MKVGFFSPLPPARTGVADYSATLLAALRKHGPVEVNAADADIALYHIGNNLLHREIYQRAIAQPGVAVLHDAVLNHFFLGTLDRGAYIDEFVYNYGEWDRGLAEDLWRNRARSAADARYFQYPMLKRLATASRAIVVHNPAAARAVYRHHPEARVIEIPHLFVPPELPDSVDVTRLRAQLGLGPRSVLAGVFGHLRESKRLCPILRTMERVWASGADVRLLVQGAFASSDLERAVAPLIAGNPRIFRMPALPEREFWRWASAADVCLNLRYPAAAESSGIAVRMMGIGKTVIFTSGEELARLPENSYLSVDPGPDEEAELAAYLQWLALDRAALDEIGRRAAEHIGREHALDKIASQYWAALSDSCSAFRTAK
jgi:glycosyltransferase involved in cell wall biosynthesis